MSLIGINHAVTAINEIEEEESKIKKRQMNMFEGKYFKKKRKMINAK